ncbi:MAG: CAP domain-containing protein [Minisyncoccia bacterium]
MFGQLLIMVLAGILALIGAGALSYTYLGETFGQREVAHEAPVVVKKEQTSPRPSRETAVSTTQAEQKKVVTKTPVTATTTNGSLVPKTAVVEKTVVAPGPLRAVAQALSASDLTPRGIIERTNIERAQNGGLPALTENFTLNHDAQMKVDDMFAKQYFDHVSPTGVGPSDLAQAVGYAYVTVGENLALGDFAGDSGVVTAWMNSQGHRANILNTHYKELGVAVGKGMYEGHMTWLAVQSFGLPLSACPGTDQTLKAQIDANNVTIAGLRAQLDAKKAQIDSTQSNDPNYNTYVNEFNAIVPGYNNLIETNRAIVATFNASVQAFNACIALASGN